MYNVIAFDNLAYSASVYNLEAVRDLPNFKLVVGDLTDIGNVKDCLLEQKIDTVFHFAAKTHVDASFKDSLGFLNTNVVGTHNLIECATLVGVGRFIHTSTDEVYGEVMDSDPDPLETAILAPTNPYAASKAAAEMILHSYFKSFKLPIIIVRSNNVYGPHQYPEKIIPKFACLLSQQKRLPLQGNGKNTRRYLYAADACDAFDTILHKGIIGQVYNIPSADEISNLSLCSQMLGLFNTPDGNQDSLDTHVYYVTDRPFNDYRYAVNGDKLKQLGWKQKVSWDEGLRTTIDWYREFGHTFWT